MIRFRIGRIALVGDLEKAFLQIFLREKDHTVCCFFWRHTSGDIVTYHLTGVFFGAKSSPFLLQAVLKYHLENKVKHKDVASDLLWNLYVDDTVNSVDDDSQAENFWTTAVNIFHQGGFNLRKFQSNSQNLKIEKEEVTTRKVLGVLWHINRPAGKKC